jgi:hypothetical protein
MYNIFIEVKKIMVLDNKLLKLSRIKYNNNYYQIFATLDNRRIFMKINDDNSYDVPELSAYLILNNIYNLPYDGKLYSVSTKRITSLLMAGAIFISSFPLIPPKGNYILTKTSNYTKNINLDITTQEDIDSQLDVDFDIDIYDVYDAIANNKNIGNSYKPYFYTFINDVISKYPDIKLRIFYNNVKNIKNIRFISKNDMTKFIKNNVTDGYIDFIDREIVFASAVDESIMVHEMGHLLFNPFFAKLPIPSDSKLSIILQNIFISNTYANGNAFQEGCNSLFIEELGKNKDNYYYDQRIVKLLCQILGKEKVFAIYQEPIGKDKHLIDALTDIKGTSEEGRAFIMKIDDHLKAQKNYEVENEMAISVDICDILTDYYFASKSKENNESLENIIFDVFKFHTILLELASFDSVYAMEAQKKNGVPIDEIKYLTNDNILRNYNNKLNSYFEQLAIKNNITVKEIKKIYQAYNDDPKYSIIIDKQRYFINSNQSIGLSNYEETTVIR